MRPFHPFHQKNRSALDFLVDRFCLAFQLLHEFLVAQAVLDIQAVLLGLALHLGQAVHLHRVRPVDQDSQEDRQDTS